MKNKVIFCLDIFDLNFEDSHDSGRWGGGGGVADSYSDGICKNLHLVRLRVLKNGLNYSWTYKETSMKLFNVL